MAIYILSQEIENILNSGTCMQKYKEQMFEETSAPIKYIFADVPEKSKIDDYRKMEIDVEQLVNMYQYLANNHSLTYSIKVEDKMGELKNVLHYTSMNRSDSEIQLIKDGYVIATVLLDKMNKDCLWGILYFSQAKLIHMEVYMDDIIYANSYVTAKSEQGLYAKLTKRTFYDEDGSVAYNQIFEGKKEWFVFPDGEILEKSQFDEEFIKKLKLSEQDVIVLDDFVSVEFLRAVFAFGKRAQIVVLLHVRCETIKNKRDKAFFSTGYYYDWFPYVESIDTVVVSTENQKYTLKNELGEYHCKVPDIKVIPIDGEFTYCILRESHGGNLALSWEFKGEPDGFLIYDELGTQICETRDMHQHYFLIKDYELESGFILKAFVDTIKGKVVVAESEMIRLHVGKYEKPTVSLIIPAYNAADYIVKGLDTALAQSFSDLEIIVVDDGSTDSTADIIDWYAEKYSNISVIHQENGGVASTRNKGIDVAQGDYIGFMDSDDTIRPDMITRLYNAANINDCDIAVTSAYTVIDDKYVKYLQYMLKENTAMTTEIFFRTYVGNELGVVVWNKLYRASLVKKRLLPEFPYEDTAWTPYILSYADMVCYLDDCSYDWNRTIRDNTLSSELLKNHSKQEVFEQRKRAVLFYVGNGNPKRRKLLKMVAKTDLLRWERTFAYEEYGKLWEWIDKNY